MKNKYVQRSRISEKKFKEILKYFALDLQANQIAQLTGISRNSVNSYIKAIRLSLLDTQPLSNRQHHTIGGTRLVFAIEVRQRRIIVTPIPSHLNHELYKLLRYKKVDEINKLLAYPYSGLIDYAGKRYLQLQHPYENQTQNLEANAFWGYTKTRLVKFRGISTQNIYLHLKECEFRYNHRDQDLYRYLLTLFRKEPLRL